MAPSKDLEQLRQNVRRIQKSIRNDMMFPTIPSKAIPDTSNSIAVFVDGELYAEYNNRIYRITS